MTQTVIHGKEDPHLCSAHSAVSKMCFAHVKKLENKEVRIKYKYFSLSINYMLWLMPLWEEENRSRTYAPFKGAQDLNKKMKENKFVI